MVVINSGNALGSLVLDFALGSVHEPGVFYTGINSCWTSKSSNAVDQVSMHQKSNGNFQPKCATSYVPFSIHIHITNVEHFFWAEINTVGTAALTPLIQLAQLLLRLFNPINKQCASIKIRVIKRNCEIPHEGPFCDLMWSDPEDIETWAVIPRGAGWFFGSRVTSEEKAHITTGKQALQKCLGNTILKKYSSTVATIFTGFASAALVGHTLTINFMLGISINCLHLNASGMAERVSLSMNQIDMQLTLFLILFPVLFAPCESERRRKWGIGVGTVCTNIIATLPMVLFCDSHGPFSTREDNKFRERIRAAVEEEERQAKAVADTDAAKDAIATAAKSQNKTGGNALNSEDQSNLKVGDKVGQEKINEAETKGDDMIIQQAYQVLADDMIIQQAYHLEFYHYYHGSNTDMGETNTWDAYIRPGGSLKDKKIIIMEFLIERFPNMEDNELATGELEVNTFTLKLKLHVLLLF
ncbi:hypothetical protein CTI12_AA139850 [Artemisia annua]|uniref:Uncharacterized protein n=1 Tax=Artemisia annua TaxID=35608 RepID=A0A2U1PL69_ARTAN|nr:hypothetical protein CTI12_AA139850 [Artemisia annua]